MLRILKISGDSLSPEYEEGDFVVIATSPFFLRRLKPGDVVVFQHGGYGTLIKKIERFNENGDLIVVGTQPSSLDSQRLGPISPQALKGKIIAHIS